MAARLEARGGWHCWLVESGGEIAGNVWLHFIEKMPNPLDEAELHGYITNLYVRPALRGRGLGASLLDQCLRVCEARVVDSVILWPTPRSRSLYERYGFAVGGDLMERR
jgi:ribosomal protein S18 acetylase RimI-like enzyme